MARRSTGRTRGSVPDSPKVIAIAQELGKLYAGRADILGVGHGWKERGGKVTGDYAVVVYVREKKPKEALSSKEMIPSEFKGFKTDVVVPGTRPTHRDDHDHSFIDLVKRHRLNTPDRWAPPAPPAPGAPPAAGGNVDIGDIAVVEDDPNDSFRQAGGSVDFVKAYKKFRNTHPDDYEWVTFYMDFNNTEGVYHSGIYNKTTGINYYAGANRDERANWGTSRLLAMQCLRTSGEPLSTILQEVGHQWSSYVRNRLTQNGANRYDLLISSSGQGVFHWGKQFDNDHSPMDYDSIDLVDPGTGSFPYHNISTQGHGDGQFCNLDLYLAGMLPESETDSFWFVQNFTDNGTVLAGTRKDLSLQNIKWAEGARQPDYLRAQKHFRQAFILLTTDKNNVQATVNAIEERRRETTWGFFRATNFLGTTDTTLTPQGRLAVIRVRAKGQQAGGAWPQMVLRVNGGVVGSWTVNTATYTDYVAQAPLLPALNEIDVVFNNDYYSPPQDRNLFVDGIRVNQDQLLSEAEGVLYDRGYGEAAFDEADVIAGQKAMYWNGALRFWYSPTPVPIRIRAKGQKAGGAWPKMLLRLNGRIVKSWTVATNSWSDFTASAPLRQGNNKIEVVFNNDYYKPSQGDRNLFVNFIEVGTRTYQAEGPGVVYDRGRGAAAFDSQDAIPGQEAMYWNGALRFNHAHLVVPRQVTIRARGQQAGDAWPRMFLRVNGCLVREWEVASSTWQEYRASAPFIEGTNRIDVAFNNDYYNPPADRNLFIDWIQMENTTIQAEGAGVTYDRGFAETSLDGVDVVPGQEAMYWNGALRFTYTFNPSPITIRARGQQAGGAWPRMQLWVNGGLVQEWNVNSTTYTDYTTSAPLRPGENRIDVVFNNDYYQPPADRNLFVDFINVAGTVIQAEAQGVYYDRGTLLDGVDVVAGQEAMYWNGALRFLFINPNT